MLSAFGAIIKANLTGILSYGFFAGLALAVIFGIFETGKKAERVNALEHQSKIVRKSHEVEDKNRADLRDGDAAIRLRRQWSRD